MKVNISMKHFLIIILFTATLYPYFFSDKLPKETTQLVESFDCFTKDDKTIIYAYVLALKYRMNHVDDRDALIKGDLDYWRLWHLVSDIESKCKLNYKFSNIIKETILATLEDRKIRKKLARVEGSIRTDGSSESSARMRKYDKKLRESILDNVPKYTILSKHKAMENYNLKPLKELKPFSIPKNVYEQIEDKKLTAQQKDILFRNAYLIEETIRSYDKPNIRHEMYQEILYLDECKKMDGYYLNVDFYPNFKRKLADRVVTSSNGYYPLKTEFLPKEVESFCEHNITKMKLSTFAPKLDKKRKTKLKLKNKKVVPKLENLKKFLSKYNNNKTKKQYANEYFTSMKRLLETPSRGIPNVESLRLLRLQNCLVGKDDKEDFALIMARVKDFRIEGLKETFYANIFNSQRWWTSTIRLKIEAEGKSKELMNFFNCNETNSALFNTTRPKTKNISQIRKNNEIKQNISKAGWQKRELIKYFCGIFEGKSAKNIDNKSAIEAGMIPKKFISKSGTIIPNIGTKLTISGMPKGGISISYEGLGRGQECEGMLEFLNMDEIIFFNNKTYRGLDYVMVNDSKIMIDNFAKSYGKTLCAKQESNTVSYVMENNVSLRKYNDIKEYKSIYHNIEKKSVIDTLKRKPYSLALNSNKVYMLSSDKTNLYDLSSGKQLVILPEVFDNQYGVILSKDGKVVSTNGRNRIIHQYHVDTRDNKELIASKASPKLYFMNNSMMILFLKKKVLFLNVESGKIEGEIQPRFIDPNREYFTPRLESVLVSDDAKDLYILSDKGAIEHWSINKKLLGGFDFIYISHINEDENLISSFIINPLNDKELILSTRKETIEFRDRKTYKLLKTLKTDRIEMALSIQISKDGKYLLGYGFRYVYVWSLKDNKLIDVIGSNKNEIYGATFMPHNSKEILIIGKSKEIWSIKE